MAYIRGGLSSKEFMFQIWLAYIWVGLKLRGLIVGILQYMKKNFF